MIKIIEIDTSTVSKYSDQLQEFEQNFRYPLGNDYFAIDHGNDYFAFFRRIGQPHFFAVVVDQKIVALAGAVLRDLKFEIIPDSKPVWYICDLKVLPKYQGQGLVQRLLFFAFKKYASISTHVYAVSMNSGLEENKLLAFAKRMPLLQLEPVATLRFFLMSFEQMKSVQSDILAAFPDRGFVSLAGAKDLVLDSDGKALNFMHLAKQPMEALSLESQYMVCLPEHHSLIDHLLRQGLKPTASATVLSNLSDIDWSFITSDEI